VMMVCFEQKTKKTSRRGCDRSEEGLGPAGWPRPGSVGFGWPRLGAVGPRPGNGEGGFNP